jgi:hypothetical protein
MEKEDSITTLRTTVLSYSFITAWWSVGHDTRDRDGGCHRKTNSKVQKQLVSHGDHPAASVEASHHLCLLIPR